jgi:CRP-like cAMP-binding protein
MQPLARTPHRQAFLDRFSPDAIQRLLWYFEPVKVEPGETVIREGDVDQSLFIVLRGHFSIERQGRSINKLEAGHVFGELAFFDAMTRTASVVARDEAEVLRLTRSRFDDMVRRDPKIACELALEVGRALSERFRKSEESHARG